MVRFLGRAFFSLALVILVTGTLFYGVLQQSNQLEMEIKTEEQAKTRARLQNKDQMIFSQQDCHLAMNKAEATHTNQERYAEAIRICRHVAAWGDVSTQFDLGILYEEGKRVTKNSEESERWFDAAARQGHVVAQYKIIRIHTAKAYEEEKTDPGQGVLDFMEAYGWLCVLEKQINTLGSPGLEIWNDPQSKYKEKLLQLRQIYADDMKEWAWPVHLSAKNRCRNYVKIFYKNPTP